MSYLRRNINTNIFSSTSTTHHLHHLSIWSLLPKLTLPHSKFDTENSLFLSLSCPRIFSYVENYVIFSTLFPYFSLTQNSSLLLHAAASNARHRKLLNLPYHSHIFIKYTQEETHRGRRRRRRTSPGQRTCHCLYIAKSHKNNLLFPNNSTSFPLL